MTGRHEGSVSIAVVGCSGDPTGPTGLSTTNHKTPDDSRLACDEVQSCGRLLKIVLPGWSLFKEAPVYIPAQSGDALLR